MITATAASRTTNVLEIILIQVKITTENSLEKQLLFYRLSAVKHNGMKLTQYTCKQCKLARWFMLGIKCSYDGFDLWKVNSLACLRQLNQVLQTLFCLGIVMGKKHFKETFTYCFQSTLKVRRCLNSIPNAINDFGLCIVSGPSG